MKKLKLLILASTTVFIYSCSAPVGVWRKSPYSKPLNIDCIKKAFHDIENVEYRYAGKKVTDEDDWGHPLVNVYRFNYTYKSINNSFFFIVNKGNRVEYRHEYTVLSKDYRKNSVDEIRSFMNKIENNIGKYCKKSS